jgi:D-3-phosphoglycerate dehydrogenase
MIAKYSTVLGEADINVSDMTNKGKGDYAYSLIDVESAVGEDVLEKLRSIDGVIRVRKIK